MLTDFTVVVSILISSLDNKLQLVWSELVELSLPSLFIRLPLCLLQYGLLSDLLLGSVFRLELLALVSDYF